MARHWISYSIDRDPRRRRRWPWNWGRGPRYGRPHVVRIQPTRQRVHSNDGERRRIWPWLLLLLLILLLLGLLAWLLLDEPQRSSSAERDNGADRTNGADQPGAAADLVPGGVVTPIDSALALTRADDGSTMVSVPDRPTLRLDDNAKVMDLGDGSCHDHRYVLMTDGKAVPIDDLDQANGRRAGPVRCSHRHRRPRPQRQHRRAPGHRLPYRRRLHENGLNYSCNGGYS